MRGQGVTLGVTNKQKILFSVIVIVLLQRWLCLDQSGPNIVCLSSPRSGTNLGGRKKNPFDSKTRPLKSVWRPGPTSRTAAPLEAGSGTDSRFKAIFLFCYFAKIFYMTSNQFTSRSFVHCLWRQWWPRWCDSCPQPWSGLHCTNPAFPRSHPGPLLWQLMEDESVSSGRGSASLSTGDSSALPSDKCDESLLFLTNQESRSRGLNQRLHCLVFQRHGTPTEEHLTNERHVPSQTDCNLSFALGLFNVIGPNCVLGDEDLKTDVTHEVMWPVNWPVTMQHYDWREGGDAILIL